MKTTTHKLTLAYVGTDYAGWQRQLAQSTVQGEIEKAIGKIWGTPFHVEGSGRTDTGVHAKGQVAGFIAPYKLAPEALAKALNYHLPWTIRVTQVEIMEPTFHARFDVAEKTYEYLLWQSPYFDPFMIDRAWHTPAVLDLGAMRAAAAALEGERDFTAFASNPGYPRTTMVRNLRELKVLAQKERVIIRATSNGFLYHMVRNLTGALVKVGRGKLSLPELVTILEGRKRTLAPASAPAFGLYLMKVRYYSKAERLRRARGKKEWKVIDDEGE